PALSLALANAPSRALARIAARATSGDNLAANLVTDLVLETVWPIRWQAPPSPAGRALRQALALHASIKRVRRAQAGHPLAGLLPDDLIARVRQHPVDDVRNLLHLGFLHAAGRHRRRAQPQAAAHSRFLRVKGDRVLVDRDPDLVQQRLRLLAREPPGRLDVHQHQVVVCAAGDQAETAGLERLGQRLGVLDDLLLVRPELGGECLLQGDRLGGDDVHQGPALHAREYGPVDVLGVPLLAEDEPAP